MCFEMLGEFGDAFGEDGDLDFRGAGVVVMGAIGFDDGFFLFDGNHGGGPS